MSVSPVAVRDLAKAQTWAGPTANAGLGFGPVAGTVSGIVQVKSGRQACGTVGADRTDASVDSCSTETVNCAWPSVGVQGPVPVMISCRPSTLSAAVGSMKAAIPLTDPNQNAGGTAKAPIRVTSARVSSRDCRVS